MDGDGHADRPDLAGSDDSLIVEIGDTGPGIPHGHPGPDLRAVLHHQAGRRGHRPRPGHLLADRGQQAPRRPVGDSVPGDTRFRVRLPLDRRPTRRRLDDEPWTDAERTHDRDRRDRPAVPPSGPGCVECDATGGWWFHLRRCAECGHIGCCDTSPSQHASAHAEATGHPFIQSFEPGEDWFWSYADRRVLRRARARPAGHHPLDQAGARPGRPGAARTGSDTCTELSTPTSVRREAICSPRTDLECLSQR